MKTVIPLLVFVLFRFLGAAQIITPQLKANFGVDADLKTNFINGAAVAGSDDWFYTGSATKGKYVIDTTGAAEIYNRYLNNTASRNLPLVRNMQYPSFSIVNNKMLIDAVFVRDFHGDDSTIFASGSNKNGMTPANWSTPVSQSTPDKNDILDVLMHVRREGKLPTDSLWMFGGLSIYGTTGNRYFDFEMYQSDIYYDRTTHTFGGYGPDAGHTSWQFDAMGNIIKAGDIILTAEYSSSSLTMIEARIWINRSSLSVTPVTFDWAGEFDGGNNGAQFGYASIQPKTAGLFYAGLQNSATTWGGPFGVIQGDNSLVADYTARQFMEFSVNLTKLGLDPVTVLGGSTCDRPYQKVLVKTRASTSFTAELKDFVGPFSFTNAAKANLFTTIPIFCGVYSVSNIVVTNPVPSSIYTWSTIDGHFGDTTNKTSVYVDAPGTYIVHQTLNTDCPVYTTDTITILFSPNCGILLNKQLSFAGILVNKNAQLTWKALAEEPVKNYIIERSTDGLHYLSVRTLEHGAFLQFSVFDNLEHVAGNTVYYRLAIQDLQGNFRYSPAIRLDLTSLGLRTSIVVTPNPVKDVMQLQVFSPVAQTAQIVMQDAMGNALRSFTQSFAKGNTNLLLTNFQSWPAGIYFMKIIAGNDVVVKQFLLRR